GEVRVGLRDVRHDHGISDAEPRDAMNTALVDQGIGITDRPMRAVPTAMTPSSAWAAPGCRSRSPSSLLAEGCTGLLSAASIPPPPAAWFVRLARQTGSQ